MILFSRCKLFDKWAFRLWHRLDSWLKEHHSKVSTIIMPIFHALEHDVLNALSTMARWKEECECLKWLDSEEPNSVVYVNFGSVIVMRPQQLLELAWGLANSKKKFMWVIRPDLVEGEAPILPPQTVEETKHRGLLGGCVLKSKF